MKKILIILTLLSLNVGAQNVPSFDIKHKATLMADCMKKCFDSACRTKCQQQYGQADAFSPPSDSSSSAVVPKKKNSHSYCMKKCGCVGKKCTLKKKKHCYSSCRS